jgi:hypothetical protein
MTNLRNRLGAVVLVLMGTGCGLIDSDVTNFDLTLPDKNFTIDATGWQVDQQAAMTYLDTSCASMPTLCATAAMQACGPDECSGSCNATTQRCELALEVSLYQPIDLLMEKPELKSINDEPVIKVELDSVTYEVTSNTLNVATPVMTIYVAPISVMEPSDPLAKAIGTIPAVPAMTTVTTPAAIMFTGTGKADLIAAMSTFKTPFNIIVGSTLVVMQGQPVPSGKLDAVVHIKGHAGL